jgi:hypothetical protein
MIGEIGIGEVKGRWKRQGTFAQLVHATAKTPTRGPRIRIAIRNCNSRIAIAMPRSRRSTRLLREEVGMSDEMYAVKAFVPRPGATELRDTLNKAMPVQANGVEITSLEQYQRVRVDALCEPIAQAPLKQQRRSSSASQRFAFVTASPESYAC